MNDKIHPCFNGLEKAPTGAGASGTSEMVSLISAFFDASPVPTFAVDADHAIMIWNRACEELTGIPGSRVLGTTKHSDAFYGIRRPVLADLIVDQASEQVLDEYYKGKLKPSLSVKGGYEAEDFFDRLADGEGRWINFSAAPLYDARGQVVGAVEIMQDVTQRKNAELALHKAQLDLEELVIKRTAQLAQVNDRLEDDIRKREAAEAELLRRNAELTELNGRLSVAQEQLMQSEKLASIGQLAAGVAHEINNPIGYIFSNFGMLETYVGQLLQMLAAYERGEALISAPAVLAELKTLRDHVELDYLKEDMPVLLSESKEGIVRVRKIVQDLKDFSRVDANLEWQWVDIHAGIDSTLNIVSNEVKYKADVIREYAVLPEIECLPSQLNQVVLNLVVNAAHAIHSERGTITIRTGREEKMVWMEISDTGCGISKEVLPRIFDPFFTTKPVGTGTGLGLSLSYGIIQKHNGRIEVKSTVGVGTTFRIVLPIRQQEDDGKEEV